MFSLRELRDQFDDVRGRGPVIVSPPPAGWNPEVDPAGSGTLTDPFHSISTAIAASNGRNVYLRGGQYIEPITVDGVHGSSDHPITIAAYRGEPVTVDCFIPDFLNPIEEAHWKPVEDSPDEFVWTKPFPGGEAEEVSRGAFLETHQHTRLVTYHHLEDLRADNELDPRDLTTGDNHVWKAKQDPVTGETHFEETEEFRNWVYMGPGLWFGPDPEFGSDPERPTVHIRMSHTHNNVIGWPDYTGITDPRAVKVALSKSLTPALSLTNCTFLRFSDMTVRFGGRETVLITRLHRHRVRPRQHPGGQPSDKARGEPR